MKKKRSFIKMWFKYHVDEIIITGLIAPIIIIWILIEPWVEKNLIDDNIFGKKILANLFSLLFNEIICIEFICIGLPVALYIICIIGNEIANYIRYQRAFCRFYYLPMTKEACEKLNIKTADEYIRFISNKLYFKTYSFESFETRNEKDMYFQPCIKDVTNIFSTCRNIFPDEKISPASIWGENDGSQCFSNNWTVRAKDEISGVWQNDEKIKLLADGN